MIETFASCYFRNMNQHSDMIIFVVTTFFKLNEDLTCIIINLLMVINVFHWSLGHHYIKPQSWLTFLALLPRFTEQKVHQEVG